MTLAELIDAVAKAGGPDRELDARIAVVAGVPFESRTVQGRGKGRKWLIDRHGGIETWSLHPPAYTSDLNAAVSLVPEYEQGIEDWSVGKDTLGPWADVGDEEARHRTPALALTLAALKARREA